MRPAQLAGVVILAFPTAVAANGVVYRPNDPGYQRARAAEAVAPAAVVAAFAATIVWGIRSRGKGRAAAAVVLGAFLCFFIVLYEGTFGSSTPIAPPNEPEPPPGRYERRPPPGWSTESEEQAGVALAVIALAGGGIWVARRSRTERQS
eukprot:Opistho-1_new@87144